MCTVYTVQCTVCFQVLVSNFTTINCITIVITYSWPAMVELDPDSEEFIENDNTGDSYHVTFLDDNVTRAWVDDKRICPFKENKNSVSLIILK